jgi:DNA topoisomerase-1
MPTSEPVPPPPSSDAPLAPGLRWASDTRPGITRQRRGSQFAYRDAKGRTIDDEATLARIRKLAIPPAWEDVWICPDAQGHLQATGRDARGRKQYRYHARWSETRGETKFAHLAVFGGALPKIRARVQRALAGRGSSATPTRGRVLATLVRLLDTTWLRIGNTEYARSNGSYGLSTLKNRHAAVKGAEIQLSFVGKSGVRHQVRLADRRVAAIVRRCRELPGQELFQYVDDDGSIRSVDSADVNAWLAEAAGGERITAKDFRTWHGSVLALELTLAACAATEGGCTPQQVLTQVAKKLGNTPAVCRKAYVHPRVLGLGDALVSEVQRAELQARAWVRQPPPGRGLSAPERQLLALLRQRDRAGDAAAAGFAAELRRRARQVQPATVAKAASQSATKRSMPNRSRAVA